MPSEVILGALFSIAPRFKSLTDYHRERLRCALAALLLMTAREKIIQATKDGGSHVLAGCIYLLQARFTAAVEIPQCLAVSAMLASFSFLQTATA